jgi:hypothetical protein
MGCLYSREKIVNLTDNVELNKTKDIKNIQKNIQNNIEENIERGKTIEYIHHPVLTIELNDSEFID